MAQIVTAWRCNIPYWVDLMAQNIRGKTRDNSKKDIFLGGLTWQGHRSKGYLITVTTYRIATREGCMCVRLSSLIYSICVKAFRLFWEGSSRCSITSAPCSYSNQHDAIRNFGIAFFEILQCWHLLHSMAMYIPCSSRLFTPFAEFATVQFWKALGARRALSCLNIHILISKKSRGREYTIHGASLSRLPLLRVDGS